MEELRADQPEGIRNEQAVDASWPWLNLHEPVPALSGYRPVIGRCGMVSSPHHAASSIGLEILKGGGNAVDAAIAVSAALMTVCPMQCGPGGDAFWLIADPTGEIGVLDAAGPAPAGASCEELRGRGLHEIPRRGGQAVTVPGAVDGWVKAHRRFSTLPLSRLLEPAARLAEDGFVASRHTRASFLACESQLREKDALALFSTNGRIPELYGLIQQPKLAQCLRDIGRSNGRSFYEGNLAKEMAVACQSWGGWLSEEDLAGYGARWVAPVSASFRTLEVFTAPPPSQGFALLAALQAVESVMPEPLALFSASTVHLLVEAANAALALRDRFNGEKASARLRDALEEMAAFPETFDAERHRPIAFDPQGTRKGDTAHLAVVDKDGMSVSLIQSLFYDFGTCIPIVSGGFTLQNRGAAFSLQDDHPGLLSPGCRPPHTLMPTIVLQSGKPRYVLGCMGGDGQMQTQLQLLVDLCVGGLDPQQAVSRARWYLDRGETTRIVAEQGAVDAAELRKKGHQVALMGRFEEIMGHAQVIEVAPGGILIGAADPRSDGQVAAF